MSENSPAPGTPQTKTKAIAATVLAFLSIVAGLWIADSDPVTAKEIVGWLLTGAIGSGITGVSTALVRNKPTA